MSAALPQGTAAGKETGRKVIVFLVRHFNDIDHIVPIVYRMIKDGAAEAKLLCMDPYLDIRNDVRIRFLQEHFGCRATYIYQAHAPTMRHRLFGFLVCQVPYWRWPRGLRWVSRIARRVARKTYGSGWTKRLYDKRWAIGWLQSSEVDRLVIDFGHKRKFVYAAIADASDELGIGKIGVPQGIEFSMDRDWTNKRVATQNPNVLQDNWGWVGEFVVAGEPVKALYAQLGIPSERIAVLGSARYCEEWVDVYHRMLGAGPLQSDQGKLKVVYMDHAAEYRVDTEAVVASLEAISRLDFVDLIVRAHTRFRLSDERIADFCHVVRDIHSVHLIQWADVVMTFTSSIIIDAMNLNRVFVYPTYFHETRMLWEEYGACWAVSDEIELVEALRCLHKGDCEAPYSEEHVITFLTDVVYAGVTAADVLGNYVDHILRSQDRSMAGSSVAS